GKPRGKPDDANCKSRTKRDAARESARARPRVQPRARPKPSARARAKPRPSVRARPRPSGRAAARRRAPRRPAPRRPAPARAAAIAAAAVIAAAGDDGKHDTKAAGENALPKKQRGVRVLALAASRGQDKSLPPRRGCRRARLTPDRLRAAP